MGKNYELAKVNDKVWKQTPLYIQEMKTEYYILQNNIKKNIKRIDKLKTKIKEIEENTEWNKSIRESYYTELQRFHIDYIPSVSPTTQKGNNFQWSINLKIGYIERKKYLGSNKNVRKKLDEILGVEKYYLNMDSIINKYTEECREEIRTIIQTNLKKEMDRNIEEINQKWDENKLKLWDYFY